MLFSRRRIQAKRAIRSARPAKIKNARTTKVKVIKVKSVKLKPVPANKPQKTKKVAKEQHGEKIKATLHSLYFSKKEKIPEPAPVEKPEFVPVADKNLERRLGQMQQYFDKRVDTVDKSLVLLKDIIDEFRKENEALRREREVLLGKINAITTGTPEPTRDELPEEISTEGKPHTASYAGSSNSSKTSMDQLLDMVVAKESVRTSEAAKKLQVKEKQVEEWARMLESHGLIEIHYPAFGKPILRKKAVQ